VRAVTELVEREERIVLLTGDLGVKTAVVAP
jgi:hypothetical protein